MSTVNAENANKRGASENEDAQTAKKVKKFLLPPIEDQLFEWEESDEDDDTWRRVYSKCITKVKMGPFAIGTPVESIVICHDLSTIEVTGYQDQDGVTLKFNGSLLVSVV
jgi:hypothetical protein